MVPAERELSLSNSASFCLADVIVLYHSELFIYLILSFVANANKHETILSALPESIEGHLDFGHVVRNADLLGKLVNGELALGVVPHIIGLELPFVIVPGLEPCYH